MEAQDASIRFLQSTRPPITTSTGSSSRNVVDKFGSILSEITLFFVLFGMAGTIEAQKLRRQLKKVSAISTGLLMQFLVMPALGYASVVIFSKEGLTYAQSITLIIVCSSPGGSFSNLWCSLFNADLALSVAMTSFSSFLGIGALPANIALYTFIARYSGIVPNVGGNITKSVNFKSLATSLGLLIAGVTLGLLFSYKLGRRFRRVAHVIGSISGVILIALSAVFASVGKRGGSKPWNQKLGFYAGVGFPGVTGIIVAVLISSVLCKLQKPDVITIAVESAFQNIAIAASAAFNIFQTKDERAQALCVPVIYGGFVTISTSIFCLIAWKLGWSKAPRNVSFLRFITTSYELETTEDMDDHMTLYAFFNHSYGQKRGLNPFQRFKRSSNIHIPVLKKSDTVDNIDSFSPLSRMTTMNFPSLPSFSNMDSPNNTRGSTIDMTDYFFHFLAETEVTKDETLYMRQVTFDESLEEINVDENLNQQDLEKQPDFVAVDEEKDHPMKNKRVSICSPESQYEDDPKLYVRIDSNYHDEIVDWWNYDNEYKKP